MENEPRPDAVPEETLQENYEESRRACCEAQEEIRRQEGVVTEPEPGKRYARLRLPEGIGLSVTYRKEITVNNEETRDLVGSLDLRSGDLIELDARGKVRSAAVQKRLERFPGGYELEPFSGDAN